MSVPLLHEGQSIGTIGVAREEPGLFPDAAVSLLQTFARQAVIAIQNVRLINETKEALELQKASTEILGVISKSVADTQPVFDKILESCKHLFGGDELCVLLVDEPSQCATPASASRRKAWDDCFSHSAKRTHRPPANTAAPVLDWPSRSGWGER